MLEVGVDELHHFTYGWLTPVLASALSIIGSWLGLVCAVRARDATSERRRVWMLILGACAIGGTGIWVMHFIALVGFSVPGSALQYEVSTTIASFLIVVVMVGFGLFVVGTGRPSVLKILVSGAVTGVSVALMHYTGVAAIHVHGEFTYDGNLVAASYVIAVVAATLALWLTTVVRRAGVIVVAALMMGTAVTAMHYTGMAAMRVRLDGSFGELPGVSGNWILAPIVLFVIGLAFAHANAVVALPSADELEDADLLRAVMGGPASSSRYAEGVASVQRRR
jgi:NO-binding membrane sensor protein with MHYT domain